MKKRLFLLPLLAVGMLCGCGEDEAGGGNSPTPPPVNPNDPVNPTPGGHTHSWSASWSHDETNHWKTCSGCTEKDGLAAHTFNGNTCSVCGYVKAADPDPVVGDPFSITLATTGYDASKYTYSLDPVIFNAGGVAWESSGKGSDNKGTFGGVSSQYESAWASYSASGIMQLKKGGAGYIQNTAALSGFTKVTIEWHATYANEGTQYFPVVYKGTSVGPTAKATCDQTAEISGTSIGVSTSEGKAIYKFTTTYTIAATDTFFKIASGNTAGYFEKVSFAK